MRTWMKAFELDPAKVRITEEEILADLRYPARRRRPRVPSPRGRRR